MKVYLRPAPTSLSRAMYRVADALERTAPTWVKLVEQPQHADLQILHTVGAGVMKHLAASNYAIIQYCYKTATSNPTFDWLDVWNRAKAVWSYYDIGELVTGSPFYLSPLGIDEVFRKPRPEGARTIDVMTSGFVTGPIAEAIEEVMIAAARLKLSVKHLGPKGIKNMKTVPGPRWSSVFDISDDQLAALYGKCRWVSGLRHVEGFEFPIIEGLACGARPIVFDQPNARRWFEGHVVFVPECSGPQLVRRLMTILSKDPVPVTRAERDVVLAKFDWNRIAPAFWDKLYEGVNDA